MLVNIKMNFEDPGQDAKLPTYSFKGIQSFQGDLAVFASTPMAAAFCLSLVDDSNKVSEISCKSDWGSFSSSKTVIHVYCVSNTVFFIANEFLRDEMVKWCLEEIMSGMNRPQMMVALTHLRKFDYLGQGKVKYVATSKDLVEGEFLERGNAVTGLAAAVLEWSKANQVAGVSCVVIPECNELSFENLELFEDVFKVLKKDFGEKKYSRGIRIVESQLYSHNVYF